MNNYILILCLTFWGLFKAPGLFIPNRPGADTVIAGLAAPHRGSACKKSLAEFRVRRRESSIIRFLPRHVRGGKHFARSERRIVRCQRTTEAQNVAKLSRNSGKAAFSRVSVPQRGCFFICAQRRGYLAPAGRTLRMSTTLCVTSVPGTV